jgi:integrase
MSDDMPYLSRETNRHGNPKVYVRRFGKRIQIRAPEKTIEWHQEYVAAREALDRGTPVTRPERKAAPSGSLGWLAALYFESEAYRGLDAVSQRTRRLIIEDCLTEPTKPGSAHLMAACPVSRLSAAHIQLLRDRKADKKGAANNRLKYLSSMFGWAIEAKKMTSNPARDVKPLAYATDGFYTWTDDDVETFERFYPIGTRPRLALALLMYLGVRRSDAVMLGRQHVKDGWIRFVPRKTRHKRAGLSEKPVVPELEAIIKASPTGALTFLETKFKKGFTAAGFGNWFRECCDKAGLPKCSAHGLRKAGATRAAEMGATAHQLMAIFDWSTISQAEVYTKAANRKKMAGEAMGLLTKRI